MDTVLYIGHSFHQKTKSSSFLLEELKASFDVTELYMDSQNQPIGEKVNEIEIGRASCRERV